MLNTFTNLEGSNGRRVIDVNNILYYTTADSGDVYKYDLSTKTPLGVPSSVSGHRGSNHAFLYSPTGTLLKTITLSDCIEFCDGADVLLAGR